MTLTIFISVSLLAALALLITGSLWINTIQERFKTESRQIRKIQLENMQTEIKNSVDALVKFIEYRKKTTETILKADLRERVQNAESIISGIYEKNKDRLATDEIKSMIVATLSDIRFNDGRGYYFIDSLEGDVVLYPTIPSSEGLNLINLQDDQGNYILQDEINLVKSKGEGYIEGYWKKPGGSEQTFKKIAYVKGFSPYNWYFGTGEYVDNVTIEMQKVIKEYVNQLIYGHSNNQYIFIHNMQGVELANCLFPELIGKNRIDLEDLNGAKVIQEQISMATSSPHGGFLTHYWPNRSGDGQMEKLTYVTAVPEWNWVIGSGIDIQFLENQINDKKQELEKLVHEQIARIILLLVFIFVLSLVITKIAVSSINRNISVFIEHMENSSHNLSMIDLECVEYNDFKKLALVSNKMTSRINTLLHKDELTGLYNRRYINKILNSLVKTFMSSKKDLSVVMLDIDLFKHINDTYGHQAGDIVLKQVSAVIMNTVRDNDHVGRYGGEEIIVILPNTANKTAIEVANRISKNIESHIFANIEENITISGGVYTSHNSSAEELIKHADENLYMAKKNGRNQIIG